MNPTNPNSNQIKSDKKKPNMILFVIISIVVLIIIGASFYILSSKNKKHNNVIPITNQTMNQSEEVADKTATISTDPASVVVKNGEVTTLSVWVDTGGQQVNAVEVHMNYPADKFDFVGIDDTDSAFKLPVEASNSEGTISIARGQIGGLSGKQLIAKVNLKAKTTNSEGEVTISDKSKIMTIIPSDTVKSSNIFNTATGTKFTIGE